jgi:hypothetical protein
MQLLVMLLQVLVLQLLVRDGGRLSMHVLVGIELHVVLLLLAWLLQVIVLVGGRLMLPVLVGIGIAYGCGFDGGDNADVAD